MGANNIKAVWLCEQIFPNADGSSAIPPEKLQKMITEGKIPAPQAGDEDLDDDLDAQIDAHVKEVWAYYDKKNLGKIKKDKAKTFFKDALDLFAFRRHCKPNELLGPGVSLGKALDEAVAQIGRTEPGWVYFKEFEQFVNTNDLEEALQLITGQTGPRSVSGTSGLLVDYSNLAEEANQAKAQIQYRDYGGLED